MSATITVVPHISEVEWSSSEFQAGLVEAGKLLEDTNFGVYSLHSHFPLRSGEVMFAELVMPGELALYPMPKTDAAAKGLPTTWAFASDGTVIERRYADRELHRRSGIDVTATAFQAKLAEIGRAFAARGLHKLLEVTITALLFSPGPGNGTHEETDEEKRRQRVTIVPLSAGMLSGDVGAPAGWSFGPKGEPIIMDLCTVAVTFHKVRKPPPPPPPPPPQGL